MNDRKLLENAAKAAGYDICAEYFSGLVIRDGYKNERKWNPLTDDGDALRLAVRIKISVMSFEKSVFAQSCPDSLLSFSDVDAMEMIDGSNDDEATRRTIVRTAAAIGETMP